MSMKINCKHCGYLLGGIEVKENYGCNACNPFYVKGLGDIPVCPDCLKYDKCVKHADKLNSPITTSQNTPTGITGNTHSAVNSEPEMDWKDHRNNMDYIGAHFCKDCGSAFQNYEQGWYDEYTGKKMFKWGCSKYGCENHCDIIGGCIYVRKWNWGIELVCERCKHKWGDYR